MRTYAVSVSAIMAALLLSGCAQDTGVQSAGNGAVEVADTVAPLSVKKASELPPQYHIDEEYRQFSYRWPRELDVYAPLSENLQSDAKSMMEKQESDIIEEDGYRTPGSDYQPNFSYDKSWNVASRNDRFLSLEGAGYEYSGGAHGMYWFESMIYDLETQTVLKPDELLADKEAASTLLQPDFCILLNAARTNRRDGEVPSGNEWPNNCFGPFEATLNWQSDRNDGKFDRIVLRIEPYLAGSYAEGDYMVELPITAEMIGLLKPDYQPYFAVSPAEGMFE